MNVFSPPSLHAESTLRTAAGSGSRRGLFRSRLLAYLCGFAILSLGLRAAEPTRLNVLFIAVDDLRPELGCYGADYIKSPNIDRVAASGRRFDRAYCQYAICGPTRASLLTGLRPDTLKIEHIDTYFRTTVPDVVTLPQYLKENGYTSVYVGKVFHPGQTDDAKSWTRHVNVSLEATSEYKLPESLAIVRQRRADAVAKFGAKSDLGGMNGGPAWEAADEPDNAYQDGKIAEGAIATLRELKADSSKPFFLGVGFHKPHLPFVAPKKYFDLYDPAKMPLTDTPDAPTGAPEIGRHSSFELRTRTLVPQSGPIDQPTSRELLRAYAACVSFIDAQIGQVINELDALGLKENTIIVIWGDHGWHLGEYGIWGKATNHEVATHVPLIVSVPHGKWPGQGTKALVEFVDVYPTLCELVGLPVPTHLAGKSFVPLLNDPKQTGKEAAFSQFPSPALREWAARPLSPAMRKTFFGPVIDEVEARLKKEHGKRYDQEIFEKYLMGYSMRTDRYRFTLWVDRRQPEAEPYAVELYDHERDPRESVNVASRSDNVALIGQLRDQLLAQIRLTPYLP